MINLKMSREQFILLSEHLQGAESKESEDLVYNIIETANFTKEDNEIEIFDFES